MEIPLFKRCYPDKNNFADVIKVKSLDDLKVEFVELKYGIGYWIFESPFYDDGFSKYRDLVSKFPIVQDPNQKWSKDANPFATIHLPEWVCRDIFDLMYLYCTKNSIIPQTHWDLTPNEWGNLYFKEETRPYDYFRLPHCDGQYGIVGNLWFTDHPEDECGTTIYKFHGKVHKGENNILYHDFQVDKEHPRFEECKELCLRGERLSEWKPLTEEEELYWGFERIGRAPARENTMTLYNMSAFHSPFVSQQCKFRWSHAYSLSYRTIL